MDALEHLIDEALCPELAQALVMLYCRHLGQPEARRTLRLMALDEPELTWQFDALDELHARHPFRDLGRDALATELRWLYRHHHATPRVLRQLRRLCRHEPALVSGFDQEDGTNR
jgi:hypothetical protein